MKKLKTINDLKIYKYKFTNTRDTEVIYSHIFSELKSLYNYHFLKFGLTMLCFPNLKN